MVHILFILSVLRISSKTSNQIVTKLNKHEFDIKNWNRIQTNVLSLK